MISAISDFELAAIAEEADSTAGTVLATLAALRGVATGPHRRSRVRDRVVVALKRRGLLEGVRDPMSLSSAPKLTT
jgi:hypothetical protein